MTSCSLGPQLTGSVGRYGSQLWPGSFTGHAAAWTRDFSADKCTLPGHLTISRTKIGGVNLKLYYHTCGKKLALGKFFLITPRTREERLTRVENLQSTVSSNCQSFRVGQSHFESRWRRWGGLQPSGSPRAWRGNFVHSSERYAQKGDHAEHGVDGRGGEGRPWILCFF